VVGNNTESKNHLIDDLVENNIHQTKIDFNKPFRISVPVVDDSISILICNYTDPDFLTSYKVNTSLETT
tara:strand:- start:1151 stop:1357 length:207 start_codon:yes stop_codon:yes gene_type:complete